MNNLTQKEIQTVLSRIGMFEFQFRKVILILIDELMKNLKLFYRIFVW